MYFQLESSEPGITLRLLYKILKKDQVETTATNEKVRSL